MSVRDWGGDFTYVTCESLLCVFSRQSFTCLDAVTRNVFCNISLLIIRMSERLSVQDTRMLFCRAILHKIDIEVLCKALIKKNRREEK